MFWDNKDDDDTTQIFKNMTFLKMPFTNKTRDEAMSGMSWIFIIILLIIGVIAFIKYLG